MEPFTRVSKYLGVLILIGLLVPPAAYAYIDPGSGSYLWLLISSGLFALAFSIKSFWFKIKSFVTQLFSKKRKNEKTPQ